MSRSLTSWRNTEEMPNLVRVEMAFARPDPINGCRRSESSVARSRRLSRTGPMSASRASYFGRPDTWAGPRLVHVKVRSRTCRLPDPDRDLSGTYLPSHLSFSLYYYPSMAPQLLIKILISTHRMRGFGGKGNESRCEEQVQQKCLAKCVLSPWRTDQYCGFQTV
ncbi:hypothetical protein BHM03_00019375 [Ensete ventricosum]|nr:hypothetical protein BHM03_00019375 [Ensete ventricosum]